VKRAVWILAAALILAAAGYFVVRSVSSSVAMTTPYQAVLLSNGSAYFGKLEGLGTPYPVLREVFYVQSVTNAETKQVSNVLVKRGKEWHAPDRMILNANMIVFVEPVTPGSRVAQLISEAKNQ
jgi:hypothetical protein